MKGGGAGDPPQPGRPRPHPGIARHPQPLFVSAGPGALASVRRIEHELPGLRLIPFTPGAPPALPGATILVLSPQDLTGPFRNELLALARAARPGRPVLFGGTESRDTLLDAINNWRVQRIIPQQPRLDLLVDGIRKAHQALELQRSLELGAAELRDESHRLEEALRVLEETEAKSREAERLATLGRITSSLIPVIGAHLDALQEFNTLVVAGPETRDPRLDELLGYAFTGIRSLHAMLDEIRSYAESRPESYRLELAEADEIVGFVVAFCRYDPLSARRRLVSDLRSGAKIRVDSFRLYQSLINLLRNAYQATPPGGEVLVRTTIEAGDGKWVVIDVENDGDPIPPDVQARLFQPFFTTKGDDGMGLGLSMCRTAIERHGGTIVCTSGPGELTRFRIRLPRAG